MPLMAYGQTSWSAHWPVFRIVLSVRIVVVFLRSFDESDSWLGLNEWDDTALQTQDSQLEPWRCEAEHATSRSWRLRTILNLHEWAGKKHFVSLKLLGQSGARARDPRLSKQAALTTVLYSMRVKCCKYAAPLLLISRYWPHLLNIWLNSSSSRLKIQSLQSPISLWWYTGFNMFNRCNMLTWLFNFNITDLTLQ